MVVLSQVLKYKELIISENKSINLTYKFNILHQVCSQSVCLACVSVIAFYSARFIKQSSGIYFVAAVKSKHNNKCEGIIFNKREKS